MPLYIQHMQNIGKRIKFFRKRAKLSQMDLELAIDASAGTVSRIEMDRVNPTKETIFKIASILNLNNFELDYLTGITAKPATLEEIEAAKAEVKDFFDKKVLAYLIDDRWRLCYVSKPFLKILNIDEKFINDNFGKTTAEYLTDPKAGLLRIFDKKHYPSVIYHNLRYYYKEVGFMDDDPFYRKTVRGIQFNPIARKIWTEIIDEKNPKYDFRGGRIAYFKIISNITVPFIYYYEPLLNNSRFRVVEWIPQNPFIGAISRLL